MDCPYCAGKARRTKKDLEFKRDGETFNFKNVPVIVCETCGEVLIEGEVFSNLTALADAPDQQPERARRRA